MTRSRLPLTSIILGLTLANLQACGLSGQSVFSVFKNPVTSSSSLKYGTPLAMLDAQKIGLRAPNINMGLKSYSNCAELKTDLELSLRNKWIKDKADIAVGIKNNLEWRSREWAESSTSAVADSAVSESAAPTGAGAGAGAGAVSKDGQTNVQEQGVDESDTFRVGVDQIFAISFDKIQVVDRATLNVQGALPLAADADAQLYTVGHKLIVVERVNVASYGPDYDFDLTSPESESEAETDPSNESMKVTVYTTAVGQMPVVARTESFMGRYTDSRLIGNQLVLVANDSIKTVSEKIEWSEFANEAWFKDADAKAIFDNQYSYAKRETTIVITDESIAGIPCNAISQRKVADFDFSLAKIISMNVDTKAPVESMGTIGQGEEIYVTADSIYLLKSSFDWFTSNSYASYDWTADEKVFIRQISLGADGHLAAAAEGEVKGHIKDRWALHSTNEGKNLVIATSTGELFAYEGGEVAQNHLFILEKDEASKSLQIISSYENFGTHEDIRAIRYIGDKVYIVTFKKTDPLFAFDISDLKSPKLLSGLKIPGFSTYLHPLADGRMLGVGFDAQDEGDFAWYKGIQVSLFDTSNPLEMARIDNHIYGTRGSSSEVTSNHHAFFYNETSKLIGLPLVELEGNVLENESTRLKFSGAQILSFENDKLVEKARISHADLMPKGCVASQNQVRWWSDGGSSLDISRLYEVDGRLLTLSSFGLKAYALNDFRTPALSARFSLSNVNCYSR